MAVGTLGIMIVPNDNLPLVESVLQLDDEPGHLAFVVRVSQPLPNTGVYLGRVFSVVVSWLLILSDVISWSHASRSAVQLCEYSQESVTM